MFTAKRSWKGDWHRAAAEIYSPFIVFLNTILIALRAIKGPSSCCQSETGFDTTRVHGLKCTRRAPARWERRATCSLSWRRCDVKDCRLQRRLVRGIPDLSAPRRRVFSRIMLPSFLHRLVKLQTHWVLPNTIDSLGHHAMIRESLNNHSKPLQTIFCHILYQCHDWTTVMIIHSAWRRVSPSRKPQVLCILVTIVRNHLPEPTEVRDGLGNTCWIHSWGLLLDWSSHGW